MTNIPLTVPVKVSVQDLTYKVNVSTAIQVVRADPYEGDYTVTPSLSEQVLETNGKVMENDVIVHAMKKGLATLPIMSFLADPNISFDKTTGKITATVSGNEEITPQVEEGYISEGTPGKIGYFGNKTLKLDRLSGGTIRPRLYGDYTVRKYYYLTGDYVFKSVTIDGLTADKVVEGNVVRIGDELDPEHIMRVEGTAVVPSGTKQITIRENGTITEDVLRYENAVIITNVPASEVDKGTKSIATNGTHDVVGYASASVAVPASAVDSGTKSITSNGTHNVIGYASASVAVPNSYSASDEGKVVSNGALVAQTSDTVTANDTYDTTLINSLTVNVSGGGSPLPSGYTQMEYLESSGTQYIDTGLYTKANQTYYIKFRVESGSTTNVFGNNLSTGCGMFIQVSSGYVYYYRFGTANYASNGNTLYNSDLGRQFLRDYGMKLDGLYMHDYLPDEYKKVVNIADSSVVEDSSIHNILFGRTTGTNSRQLSSFKIYYFKCTEGDTVVREMYPCMRNSDNVLGFYDVANNQFYTNAGTGTFTGGAL